MKLLNHSKRENLLKGKMNNLNKLQVREIKQIFGGATSHKSDSKCTKCDDCMCDGQFENNGPDLDNLTEKRDDAVLSFF